MFKETVKAGPVQSTSSSFCSTRPILWVAISTPRCTVPTLQRARPHRESQTGWGPNDCIPLSDSTQIAVSPESARSSPTNAHSARCHQSSRRSLYYPPRNLQTYCPWHIRRHREYKNAPRPMVCKSSTRSNESLLLQNQRFQTLYKFLKGFFRGVKEKEQTGWSSWNRTSYQNPSGGNPKQCAPA